MVKKAVTILKNLKISKNIKYPKINIENYKEPSNKKLINQNISILDVNYSENFWKQEKLYKDDKKKY